MKLFLAFCQPYKVIGGPILTANTVGDEKDHGSNRRYIGNHCPYENNK